MALSNPPQDVKSPAFFSWIYQAWKAILGNSTSVIANTAAIATLQTQTDSKHLGVATLSSGNATVATTAATASSAIVLTPLVGVSSVPHIASRTAGTGFTISTGNAGDAGSIQWLLIVGT
jgi:hypothetical protein